MVSIRKANKTTPAAKPKRQSSIRRLAAKLGSKAARREAAAVYKPSETPVEEDDDDAVKQHGVAAESNGTRRSRRLLEQKQDRPRPDTQPDAASTAAVRAASPPKAKLRKERSRDTSSSSGQNKPDRGDAFGTCERAKGPGGPVPSLSLMMADWEIAPGRIRVGNGDAADGERFLLRFPLPLIPPFTH